MTPLYLVCMPLVFLTLAPGIELDLFYSLVPITGVALLLKALILGNYGVAFTSSCRCCCRPWSTPRSRCAGRSISSSARMSCSARPSESVLGWLRHLFRDPSRRRRAARRSYASP